GAHSRRVDDHDEEQHAAAERDVRGRDHLREMLQERKNRIVHGAGSVGQARSTILSACAIGEAPNAPANPSGASRVEQKASETNAGAKRTRSSACIASERRWLGG